jgi:D-methionine transport system permease protein
MSPRVFELLIQAIGETALMVFVSGAVSFVLGLPLGLVLVATDRHGIRPQATVNRVLGWFINGFRSVPFIILLVALIPLTRLIVGTSIGTAAAIVWEVLIPEALPGLAAGFTVTLVGLIGESAVAGAVGAGGLGDLAIRYGYQRFETAVMVAVVAVLIVLVCGVQFTGDRLAKRLDHRT